MPSRRHLIFAAACASLTFACSAVAASRQDARLQHATKVLNELQASPDQNVPQWLLERAYAVAIIPDVIKVGLGIGGRRGSGVLVIRRDNGHWSNPVFVNLTGGSIGFQLGVQSTDVMLVFTSRASVEGLVGGKVTLGADASVAAGPVGRATSAATDVGLTAQVYSYSRAKGLFAGVALDGSAITISHGQNAAYYGRPGVLASEIVAATAPAPPDSAQQFTATLDRILGVAQTVAQSTSSEPRTPSGVQMQAAPQPADLDKLTTRPMEDPNPGAEPPQ
jgi:lipid-binding SYLF domain-containing protein